jgi:hypothetical protein
MIQEWRVRILNIRYSRGKSQLRPLGHPGVVGTESNDGARRPHRGLAGSLVSRRFRRGGEKKGEKGEGEKMKTGET